MNPKSFLFNFWGSLHSWFQKTIQMWLNHLSNLEDRHEEQQLQYVVYSLP